ncbi:MAG: YkgJ family cysteine cluster protein [Candidatus Woesearchaeota archaeon]
MITCDRCKGQCCRTLAVQLDTPDSLEDYEDMFWYLYHQPCVVYIDMNDRWWIQLPTKCIKLDEKGRCTIYEKRPPVCRTSKVENCEMNEEEVKIMFKDVNDFQAYFDEVKKQF